MRGCWRDAGRAGFPHDFASFSTVLLHELFVQRFPYLLRTEALVNVPHEKTCPGPGAFFAPSDERPA